MDAKLTKRIVDAAAPAAKYYFVWDAGDGAVKGFGLKVNPNGQRVFVAQFRIGAGRQAIARRVTIGTYGAWTVERARDAARELIRQGNDGIDTRAAEEATKRAEAAARRLAEQEEARKEALRLDRLVDRFMNENVLVKRKKTTIDYYKIAFQKHILPKLGKKDAREISRQDVAKLHLGLSKKPTTANRCVTILGAVYNWAIGLEILPDNTRNPCMRLEKFPEQGRERYLTTDELSRLGESLRIAETEGIEWLPNPDKKSKHAPSAEYRKTVIGPEAAAAIRLLIFTSARLREILHLEWRHVDFERGVLLLPDSKTGKKTIILNAPALSLLSSLDQDGVYVIAGEVKIDGSGRLVEKPKADLKRPWSLVTQAAGLQGLRIHDLRHSFASFGAGGGLGLPIIGRLLGHSQPSTTARYAHLDSDPLRQASEAIARKISKAMVRNDNDVNLRVSKSRLARK
jgi:integrase